MHVISAIMLVNVLLRVLFLDVVYKHAIPDHLTLAQQLHVFDSIVDSFMTYTNLVNLLFYYDNSKLFDWTAPMPMNLKLQMLNYMALYAYGSYRSASVSSVFHHILTLMLLGATYHYNFVHLCILGLGITSVSTPFLSYSRMCKAFEWERAALCHFSIFTLLFVTFRIYAFPLWFLKPILIHGKGHPFYDIFKMIGGGLYALQWFWLLVIGQIFYKTIVVQRYGLQHQPAN